MAEANQSTDRTTEQQGTGYDQLYIVKRGIITIPAADFSGSPPTAQGEALIKRYTEDATDEPLFYSFDVYHYAQDPLNEFPVDLDEAVIKAPYSYSQQRAVCWFGWDDVVGSGFHLKLIVDYTASGTSGSPFASDTAQTFYYIVYSQSPITE